ncbi:hypothetical protein C1H46_018878 [Malus baccata]|uniref:Reverse transcriptase zinc-binding domain-containing protein n=1 Tax=Malus baccata TaxID=106549 RepID=A0A540MAE5_MALBA|nr:hypothetical protein C1H46_018878 [Malus baccata]
MRLIKQKKHGGLGFRDMQCFNLALLAKIGWRVIHTLDSLLAKVLCDKYYHGKTFCVASMGKKSYWGWNGITEARKVLDNGLRWHVGNGQNINTRMNLWFQKPSTFMVRPWEGFTGADGE